MGRETDFVKKKFGPLREKTLKNAVSHAIGEGFPHVGGVRIKQLCAEMILEVVEAHLRPRQHVKHGQVLWLATDVHDPPARGKRAADTRLIPVVLDLSSDDDIQARLDRKSAAEYFEAKVVRLCHQAYEQGGVLSNCDLAELLSTDDSKVALVLTRYERRTGQVVPRRATVHDVGTGLTHKRIICWKRYGEGKSSDQIARESYHSIEAVDRYLGQFDRVRHCRSQGMTPEQTAYTLACGVRLVREYLDIDEELNRLPDERRGKK